MKIVLTLLAFLTLAFAEPRKLVIDLTTADAARFEARVLNSITMNKEYYKENSQELKVAVVIHGGSYKFFFKEHQDVSSKLKKRTKELHEKYDVEFLMCGFGMKKRNIDKKQIVDYVKVIPNATIGLIEKQNSGYAFLPVGDF